MSEFVHLVGAEDVQRAAHRMQEAAQRMERAARTIDEAVTRLERLWQEYVDRVINDE